MREVGGVIFPKILFGGDYNPEQYPKQIWDEDMRLFRLAGIDVATVNVFSWALNQPDENTYKFDWLDEVMDKLHANGIYACMGTGTAAHPAWMARKYPDVLAVDYQGTKRKFGRRHNSCPNSPTFLKYSGLIARKLAERYKSHPALLLWHVNNEYGVRCYCGNCEMTFREWLKKRYGSLEKVNEAWYTRFWGHTLYDWEDIVLPSGLSEGLDKSDSDKTAFQGATLDYYRFASESLLNCYLTEYNAIKEVIPDAIVTTNFQGNGTYKPLDYFKWAKHMDIAALDMYPPNDASASYTALRYDLMRGMKDGAPFMLMESTPGVLNWKSVNPLKRPGAMRLQSYQAVARGAETVMFFQLRRSSGAYEKFHGAVIDHAGHENTRVFRECAELGNELRNLEGALPGSRMNSRVAILFDWENWWAVEFNGGPTTRLKYLDQVQKYYDAFYENHIQTDIVSVDSDLNQYEIIIAPLLYMVKPGVAGKLENFVENGGTLIVTFFSGVANENDQVVLGGYPGELRKLLGIWVEEIDALFPNQKNVAVIKRETENLGKSYECGLVCEIVHPEGAEVIAEFGSDFYVGSPSLTRHRFGKGEAWYTGSDPEPVFLQTWVAHLCECKGISPLLHVPPGVEVTQRIKEGTRYTFLLNHTGYAQKVDIGEQPRHDLLNDTFVSGVLEIPPAGVMILREA
ncbi:beta-galactosidase [Paenibacillus alkalitolerans]|uniref:beta-galactosidase n=1 Tax=Paenibacillus alkalitolerans TaxID=2799335 RepID=UPI0018F288B8|nr:beta-galactosidase [Paenibacillus alkalitolerans]